MKIKFKYLALLALTAATLATAGCATNQSATGVTQSITFLGITIYPTNAYTVAKDAVSDAALYGMSRDTNITAYLQSAYQILNDALGSTNFSPADLQSNLSGIDVSAIQNPLALALITEVFSEAGGIFAGLDANAASASPFLLPIFEGIRDGIGSALGIPPSSKLQRGHHPQKLARLGAMALLPLRRKRRGALTASALGLFLLAGCTLRDVYPETQISGYVDGRPFKFQAPKDYDVTGFDASVDTNGRIHLHVDSLKSSLNPTNINAVATGQAQIVAATGAVAHQAAQDALSAAAAAAK